MRPGGCRVPQECPQELADLISACMAVDPSCRPNAKELHDCLKVGHVVMHVLPWRGC